MSFEQRMEEEYIPPAPAFCQRVTPEEAKIQAQKFTKIGLENLYHDVVNKIDENRRKKEDDKEVAEYSKVMKQSKLLEQIEKFFECDEERQKAKFMNMLIENKRNAEKMANLESKIVDLENIVNELKDNEEHMNDVMSGYEEEENELKKKVAEQRIIIKERDLIISENMEMLKKKEIDNNRTKIFYRFIIFMQTIFFAYYLTNYI